MTHASALAPSLMTSHAAALRRLARRLVRDPDDAEDALQETWLRALQAPPRAAPRVQAWLEAVLRNVVRRRARQRQRRLAREQRAARPVAVDATVDVVVQRQALRALTDAVLALPRAQQEVVFARYFEGLPPRAIARRTARPVAEVYRLLERARRALRRDLSGRLGGAVGWRRSLGALCGLPWRQWRFGFWTGGMLVALKKQVALALVAACAVALVLFVDPGAPYGEVAPPPGEAGPPAAMSADGAVDEASHRPARSALPATADADPLAAPYSFAMEIRARDEDDLPVPGAKVWIGPAHHELNRAETGEDGVLRLSWRGRVPSTAMVWTSPDDLTGGRRLRRCTVHAGALAVVPLRLARRQRELRSATLTFVSLRLDRTRYGLSTGEPPPLHVDDEGTAWFVTAGSPAAARWIDGQVLTLHANGEAKGVLRLALREQWTAAIATGEDGARGGTVRGLVHDAGGAPAAGVLVVVGPEPDRPSRWRNRTAADGTFVLEGVPPGGHHLRAGGGDHGVARGRVEVTAGGETSWFGHLDRGLELHGRLTGEDGAPLQGWQLEVVPQADQEGWIDGAVTGEDGRFAIPNVLHRPHVLRARPAAGALTAWQTDGLWPGAERALVVPAAARAEGALRALPVRPGGEPYAAAELRLWLDERDEGVLARPGGEETRAFDHLPLGVYRLVAAAPGHPHVDAARVPVTNARPLELGPVELAEGATLSLPDGVDPGDKPIPLLRLHPAVPSRAGQLDRQQRELALPPGRYRAGLGAEARELDVRPGANVLPGPEKR